MTTAFVQADSLTRACLTMQEDRAEPPFPLRELQLQEQRVAELVRAMRIHAYSRNKYFQEYELPLVQKARRLQVRLDALEALFLEDPALVTRLRRVHDRQAYLLELWSRKLSARWTAYLGRLECELLRDSPIPQLRSLLPA